jgi:hypothetical protein
MAINPETYSRANFLLQAVELSNKIFAQSKSGDKQIKLALQALNEYSKCFIEAALKKDKLTSYEVKSIENEFFNYWNNTINEDVETFWEEITKSDLPFQRKSALRELLTKGRLRQVEQWIDLYNNFQNIKESGFLNRQFKIEELVELNNLIEKEEKNRFTIVNNCLQKKRIPFSQYLKFGESMAFLERCGLTRKYFTDTEKGEIYEIWKSTK